MHSPDHKPSKKATTLKDKKKQLSLLLFKGSLMVSPKSTYQTTATQNSTVSEIKVANRFDLHSATRNKTKPCLEPQILHEARTNRYPKYQGFVGGVGDSSDRINAILSPRYVKTNPITQHGNELIQEWRPMSKQTPMSNKTTMFTAEEKPRAKAKGTFHAQSRPAISEVPEVSRGIRTFSHALTSLSPQINERRVLRAVATSPETNKPNPITVGEDKPIKQRQIQPPFTEWTLKSSEKKMFLPCEREQFSPNRPNFQKPSALKSVVEQDPFSSPLNRRTSQSELNQELIRRKSATIGGLFDHTLLSDSKFKTTSKVNEAEYNVIRTNLNTEKTFARVQMDIY